MQRVLAALLATVPAAAFAQAADSAAASTAESPLGGSGFGLGIQLVLIIGVMYLFLIRPQQKRMKEHQAALAALKKGDEVLTGGGVVGKITKIDDTDRITVEIAKGVEVVVLKSTVTGLAAKPIKAAVIEKKKSGNDKNDNATVSRSSVANDN